MRPVTSLRHSPENGSANSAQRSARPAGASAERMRSACAWKRAVHSWLTVLGDIAGRITLRSAMCAAPSLRIMLWPISRVISPAGWSELKTSICFSQVMMSSWRVSSVLASCGT